MSTAGNDAASDEATLAASTTATSAAVAAVISAVTVSTAEVDRDELELKEEVAITEPADVCKVSSKSSSCGGRKMGQR